MPGSNAKKHVLICGHRSFPARGLRHRLEQLGHQVSEFSRGANPEFNGAFSGPVTEIHRHPFLSTQYDVVVNFIVLKQESIERNLEYLHSLLALCRQCRVKHLIHVSSMNVYLDSISVYTEDAPVRSQPERYGPNAAAKLAGEIYLREHSTETLVSLLRPACILGDDMPDPIGSVGSRLRSQKIVVLSRGDKQRPVISRSLLQTAIERCAQIPPKRNAEVLLLVDRDSPTCYEYLQGCCDILNLGTRAVCYPAPIWAYHFVRQQLKSRRRRFSFSQTRKTIHERLKLQTYDPSKTERRLGMSLNTDWRRELRLLAESLLQSEP